MTTDELGAFLFDLLSEATDVVDTVWVRKTPTGPLFVVGLHNGTLHHIAVTAPPDA